MITLQETNISPKNGILKMIFLFPRWDMLIPWMIIEVEYFYDRGMNFLWSVRGDIGGDELITAASWSPIGAG